MDGVRMCLTLYLCVRAKVCTGSVSVSGQACVGGALCTIVYVWSYERVCVHVRTRLRIVVHFCENVRHTRVFG